MTDTRARQSVLIGILRVARGRADGIGYFGGTSQSYLASLAPLIAFPLVGAGLATFTEGLREALTGLAMTLCVLLTPAVLSFELARLWRRTDHWPRFATAFNWCEWTLPVLACVIMIPLSAGISAGMDQRAASIVLIVSLCLYGLWLHWFLARNALSLSIVRATLMVVLVNMATAAVLLAPRYVAEQLG